MKVKELMTTETAVCKATDSLHTVAHAMSENDCGSMPVITSPEERRAVGMITDRDICLSAMRKGKPLEKMSVSDAMTKALFSCAPEDDLEDAQHTMRTARIRRMPVLDGKGRIEGMLSLAQLACAAGEGKLAPDVVGMTLASICEPSSPSSGMDRLES